MVRTIYYRSISGRWNMRAKKYAAACILFCVMLLGVTVSVSAKETENGEYRYDVLKTSNDTKGFVYGDIKQGICLQEYLGDQTEVVIPKEIDGLPVIKIEYSCFWKNTGLQKVSIPESVIWIDGFSGCSNLTEVVIEEGAQVIGCDALKIAVP